MTTRLFLNLATALAYALFGWLSLKVSTPPDYVSLVFLPAGLALAVVLIWGIRLTPGVFLGSLLVQVLAHNQASVASWSWSLLLAPAGAAIQAWATAWMVWRWVGYPSAMDTPTKVALFMFLITPMGSMINASLSVPLLVAGGAIPAADALYSWWTWWLGDALGVVLLAPMVLALFGEPAEAWRPRTRTVALPMVFALVLTSGSFYQLRQGDERALSQRFQQETHEQALRLQRRLDAQADSVVAIAKLMQLTQHLSEADFKAATRPWLERYSGTQNFGWSPLVKADQRTSFETPPWRGGAGGLEIKGRDANGQVFKAPQADYHLPITLVEPLDSNRSVLGLDVRVLPATAASVASTQQTGLPTTTQAIRLVQEAGEQRGVVMYQAVFHSGTTTLKGVVSAVFRMDDVLQAVLDPADTGRWTLCLIDAHASAPNRRLSGPSGCENAPQRPNLWAADWPLRFGGQNWQAHFVIGPQYLAQSRNWTTWVTLATGLGSVAMLGAFLMVITGLNRRTQRLVEQRTVELARSNATLAQLAHFDPLTGLSNRTHWMAQAENTLREAQERGEPMAIMFLDLDRFKHVNDSLGHSQGDLLLQTVAQRLRVCLRARDVLARLGGDEFVVLLPKLKGREGAAVAARKIVKALSEPVTLDNHEVTVSASLGLAYYPGDGEDVETLLRHADTAMYAVKDSGRNSWRFFAPDMTERLSQRLVLETGLRRALQPEARELFLEYQPQVNGAGDVLGTEALVRWRHPELGVVPPDRFIPIAEDAGLIDALGQWVLKEACLQLRQWHAMAAQQPAMGRLRMAVNISALEFNRPSFIAHLREVLLTSGVRADCLELEITESLLMQALPDLNNRLSDITALGVTLALDDFGTGYSSLGYLKRLPLSKVKIDRSFVTDIPGDAEDEAIVRATISMAHDLGLQVVAEGVETPAQRDFLTQHHCDAQQGWLYSRSLPAEALPAWVQAWQANAP
ncbi:MAG: hypothetical protein RJA09_843 [Pseudomonadota bacterium]